MLSLRFGRYDAMYFRTLLAVLAFAFPWTATAQSFAGSYVFDASTGPVLLTLEETNGTVVGRIVEGTVAYRLQGQVAGTGITGMLRDGTGQMLGFTAERSGDGLQLRIAPFTPYGQFDAALAQTVTFTRRATAGGVVVNGTKLTREQLATLQQRQQVPIPAGRYWYDAATGVWGYEGGPWAGAIEPGMDLPGPMPADISGGGTGIFINGREIHPKEQQDLLKLIGQTVPGRYWMDAKANVGREGEPAFLNLAALAKKASGNTYGSVYSSGTDSWLTSDGEGNFYFSSRDFGGGYSTYSSGAW